MEEWEEYAGTLVLAFLALAIRAVGQFRLPPVVWVVVFVLGWLLYAVLPLFEVGIDWANTSPNASRYVSGFFPILFVLDKLLSGPLIWAGYAGANIWMPPWQWIAIIWAAADLAVILIGWSVVWVVRSKLTARHAA